MSDIVDVLETWEAAVVVSVKLATLPDHVVIESDQHVICRHAIVVYVGHPT